MFKNNVFELSVFEKINFSNKIVIISSFLIFFFIPFIQKIKIYSKKIKEKIKSKNFIILISIILLCILSFNYKSGAGGGFFFINSQLSYLRIIHFYFWYLFFLYSISILIIY